MITTILAASVRYFRKGLLVSLPFHAFFLGVLGVLVQTEFIGVLPTQGVLKSCFLSYDQLQQHFPQHFELANQLVWALRVAVVLAFLVGSWFYTRNKGRFKKWLENQSQNLHAKAAGHLLTTLAWLVIYLVVYCWSASSLSEHLHAKFQLWLTNGWLAHLSAQVVYFCFVHWKEVKAGFLSFLLKPDQPYNLTALRILFAGWSIVVYLEKLQYMMPTVELEQRVELPLIGLLVDVLPISGDIYTTVVYVGIAACVLIIIGFRTRTALVINFLCCLYIISVPNFFGKLWHDHMIIWVCWLLTISNCFDVLSVDAFLGKKTTVQSGNYTFPVRLVWLQFGVIYFWAGFYKFWDAGFDWALSDSMINQIQLEWVQNYDKIPAFRWDQWPMLVKFGGLIVVLFELAYFFLILFKRTRLLAIASALLMHEMIKKVLYIVFWKSLQVYYLAYFNFNWLIPKKFKAAVVEKDYSKIGLRLGLGLVGINFLFGLLSIDSYPFSAYPKYAAIIPDTVEIIHFEALDANGSEINVHELAEENGFRWENYGWVEYNLIQDSKKEDVSDRMKSYWQIWVSYNPELENCTSVKAILVRRPVSPEGKLQSDTLHVISTVVP